VPAQVHNHDGPNGYQIDPSYESPGQIGYDVPCDRDEAMLIAGEPRMLKGA